MLNFYWKSLLAIFITSIGFSQSDGCTTATSLPVTADCSSPTLGTTTGATETIPGCTGTADDDVWYTFTATATAHQITVNAIPGFDPVVQLFSGGCGTLISLACRDNTFDGGTETINATGLTISEVYTIRIYDWYTGSGTGDFDICITEAPAPPSNDDCAGATALTVDASCSYSTFTTDGATESSAGCAGNADDDVWFSFTATNSVQTINATSADGLDLVFQVYEGACGSLSSLACVDNTFTNDTETQEIVGLTPGNTYFVRVYDYYSGTTGAFDICVFGEQTPAPTNDEPCDAIQLPEVTAACQFSEFTTVGATASLGAPTPTACEGGSAPQEGGFSSTSADVWFSITVPDNGYLHISAEPNLAGGMTDGVMALYSGTCGSLTQIACSDDNDYPGSGNDLLPLISETGLTPGSTVFLRYWGYGDDQGEFGICATTALNDECVDALYICDINGYSASTSPAYTEDRPSNMYGNGETSDGTWLGATNTTHSGGPFGYPDGESPTGYYDVRIDNNSWIKFTASATTATLEVDIYDCWIGSYPSGGIQMQIFEGTDCTNFIPVSNFEEGSDAFTITATGLTVGNDYYLMVDGYGGDVCNYTITAESGVQFPDIADVPPICPGETVTLTAPNDATSYEWQHDGSTTQSVDVTPGTTQTFYCEVTGLCDYKQTLDVQVEVKPLPNVVISEGASTSICNGESINLNATGADTYSWSSGESGSTITVSPSSTTNYTVTGTVDGCENTDDISVNVNTNPTISGTATITDADCGMSNGSITGLTGNGTATISYEWTDGGGATVGTSSNLTGIPAGTYFLEVTDGNGCTVVGGPYSVSNPGAPAVPTITATDLTPCADGTLEMSATSDAGVTYNWTGPNGFSATTQSISVPNPDAGTYCVTATISNCTSGSACESVTIAPDPIMDISALNDDSTICEGQSFELTASGADSYSWTGPNGFTENTTTVNVGPMTAVNEGYYVVEGTNAEGCSSSDSMLVSMLALPTVSITPDQTDETYCSMTYASLSASGADTYSWTGPNGYTHDQATANIFDLTAQEEGWYYVTGTDTEGCASEDSLYLTVVTEVLAVAGASDSVVCPGEDVNFFASGGESYVWTGPENLYTEEGNFTLYSTEAENSGWYYVNVTDENGCIGTDSTHLSVEPSVECLRIPNLTTPDGDGMNDTWHIEGLEKYDNTDVHIYNRWGNLIYQASPYLNDWDGTVNSGTTIDGGGKVPVGTYFYILEVEDKGETDTFKGYIEVQY